MTIRVFVGCSPEGMDAEAETALEYALRSRCSENIELTWMAPSRDPASPWFVTDEILKNWATPFSGLRWRIPAFCDYDGHAIYMDYDMLPLADLAGLWFLPMRGASVLAKSPGRTCVMLMDCRGFHLNGVARGRIDPFPEGQNWNCLDGENLVAGDPAMKILHFTTIDAQPHLPRARARLAAEGRPHWFNGPLRPHWRPELTALWEREYLRALRLGADRTKLPCEKFGPFQTRPMPRYQGHRPQK